MYEDGTYRVEDLTDAELVKMIPGEIRAAKRTVENVELRISQLRKVWKALPGDLTAGKEPEPK